MVEVVKNRDSERKSKDKKEVLEYAKMEGVKI
jgi:hypothetical protein